MSLGVPDYSQFYAETELEFGHLLEDARQSFSEAEQKEVLRFLAAREYGMALETFTGILIEESKFIRPPVLQRLDKIAAAIGLQDEGFIYDLHNIQGSPDDLFKTLSG